MLKENVLLKDYTNYKIGGNARYFLDAELPEELVAGLNEWQEQSTVLPLDEQKTFILGGGTNVLAPDEGFPGLIIHPNIKGIELLDNNQVKAGAGVLVTELLVFCLDHNLSGLEWAGGLPGTVGGAVFGNAGAFGGEIKDNIVNVESVDIKSLIINNRDNGSCQFGYRTSIFKSALAQKEIILTATFQFKPGDKNDIQKAIDEKIVYRQLKQPLDYPSAGSTFKNISVDQLSEELKNKFKDKIKNDPFPVLPVAVILADAKLQGKTIGGAQVSEKHPNFLINKGNATASNVENLIKQIIDIVKVKYNIVLEPEIIKVK